MSRAEVSAVETLVSGLGQLESPRWHEGLLWVADWTAGVIRTVDSAGHSEVVIEHRSTPLCFDFLPDGTPMLVSGPQRALLVVSSDATLTRYADLSVRVGADVGKLDVHHALAATPTCPSTFHASECAQIDSPALGLGPRSGGHAAGGAVWVRCAIR
jgi:sugar lactone lactonase YvrE